MQMQIIFLTLLLPLAHAGWFTSTPEESFLAAGKSGDVEVVKKWLKNEGNIDTQDSSGTTALINAAYYNQKEVAQFLINAGANVEKRYELKDIYGDIITSSSRNALEYAAEYGHVEIIQMLNIKKASTRGSALFLAA